MVMGPTCGMILGDLGAEVIKVEPPGGDKTRRLIGSGAGFFPLFNRNKKSVTADLSDPKDHARIEKLIATADIVSENFRAGALAKHGFDYASLKKKHKRLIYVSHKGFLPGPYDHRVALDEVVQMMAGLAYMTGPPGRPLRAGSSVNDIMGGMFGVIGALAALTEREHTGEGQEVQVGLFENCVLLSAQHMLQYTLTGVASPPMPDRINAWGVFDLFETSDGQQVFLGVVTDTQWVVFGRAFDLGGLATDPRLASNNLRVQARSWMLPALREVIKRYSAQDLQAVFEREGLPYAPIVRPEQLYDDPHLKASGGLADLTLESGEKTPVPLLPILLGGRHLKPRLALPKAGEHNPELLADSAKIARRASSQHLSKAKRKVSR
jgi:crotonobetainyl-CoA:carnitine CoA-transferase CaiB-like acyl-CoA transferase